MFEKIPAPVKGQPARASWGAGVSSRLNELCAMAPARGLARDGLTGTGFAPLPENRRNRAPSAVLPWSFSCTEAEDPENPGETVRTGGWDNCRLQVGLDTNFYSSWRQHDVRNRIKGTSKTDDGQYFVKVNLSDGADPVAEIVTHGGFPVINYEAGTVEIYIGTVSDGKLDEDDAPHFNPVIWKYL